MGFPSVFLVNNIMLQLRLLFAATAIFIFQSAGAGQFLIFQPKFVLVVCKTNIAFANYNTKSRTLL